MSESNGYVSAFIGDGQEREVSIEDAPGQVPRWSPFRVRFRPLSTDEELAIAAESALKPNEPIDTFYKNIIGKKLLGWDLRDGSGAKVECKPENVGRLNWFAYRELRAVVCGEKAIGPYPTKADNEKN